MGDITLSPVLIQAMVQPEGPFSVSSYVTAERSGSTPILLVVFDCITPEIGA